MLKPFSESFLTSLTFCTFQSINEFFSLLFNFQGPLAPCDWICNQTVFPSRRSTSIAQTFSFVNSFLKNFYDFFHFFSNSPNLHEKSKKIALFH